MSYEEQVMSKEHIFAPYGIYCLYFRKFKVALNPMYRIFLNFAKSCVLSCLSNVDNIKNFHRPVFELEAPKAVIKGVFSK